MTVICVKDGIMAVDSSVTRSSGRVYVGSIKKWIEAPESIGGGFIAGAGTVATVEQSLRSCAEGGNPGSGGEDVFLHLRQDGTVWSWEGSSWFHYESDIYAEGAGWEIAFGAMAAGATAEEAAMIACRHNAACAEPVTVLSIKG